jgi:hypothetical protein
MHMPLDMTINLSEGKKDKSTIMKRQVVDFA